MATGQRIRISKRPILFHGRPPLFYKPRELRPLGGIPNGELADLVDKAFYESAKVGFVGGLVVFLVLYIGFMAGPATSFFAWIAVFLLCLALPNRYRTERWRRVFPDTEIPMVVSRDMGLTKGVECPECHEWVIYKDSWPPFKGKCWKCGSLMEVSSCIVKDKIGWHDRDQKLHTRRVSYHGLDAVKMDKAGDGVEIVQGER
jgi:hypothetical protein